MNIAAGWHVSLINLRNIGVNRRVHRKSKLDLALNSVLGLLLCLAIDHSCIDYPFEDADVTLAPHKHKRNHFMWLTCTCHIGSMEL